MYTRCFAATIWQKLCHEDPLLLNDLVGDGILRDCNGGIAPDITCLCDEMKLGEEVQ